MFENAKKKTKHFQNIRIQIFFQFILIFLIMVAVVLLSSSSFYIGMIESVNSVQMKNATDELKLIDINTKNAFDEIYDLEQRYGFEFEIYLLNDTMLNKLSSEKLEFPDLQSWRSVVYATYNYSFIKRNGSSIYYEDHYNPIINYSQTTYTHTRSYDDLCYMSMAENATTGQKNLIFESFDLENRLLYVTALKYTYVEAQAKSIAFSATMITAIIFVAVSVVAYFYITQITKPLNDIIQITKIMADEKNRTIRIPIRKNTLISSTDDAIKNINALYESLMLTQEHLLEKSEFLSSQLEAQEAEQKSKTQFIADTSHELKAPISIIQGYAEGIKYLLDDKEAALEYCDTIVEECQNMTNLVVNMMSLSNIENSDNLDFSDFLINNFIDERLKLHQKIFETNGINAINKIKSPIYGYGDVEKLRFVINNLLSNAVSYIGGEEKIIAVTSEDKGSCHRIFVFNTGDPIDQDNMQRLWDSFYRSDHARVRSEGHFGLGLSIVKAVQDAHSQQCGVENADNGVIFWFDIAKGNCGQESKTE